jgi:hypothetical protein
MLVTVGAGAGACFVSHSKLWAVSERLSAAVKMTAATQRGVGVVYFIIKVGSREL